MDRRKLRFEDFPQEDRVTVRLRHGDRERFARVAEQYGMSLSGLLREGAEVVIGALSEAEQRRRERPTRGG